MSMIPRQQGNGRGGRADPFSDPFFNGGGRGDPFAGMNQMMAHMDTVFGGGGDGRRSGRRGLGGGLFGGMMADMDQMMSSQHGGGSGIVSSSSYSYCSSGGPNGQTYQRTTQSTMGPGGVAETHSTEKDSRTGTQKVLVERRIGDRSRTIVRERGRDGLETKTDTLNNLTQEQAAQFDTEFQQSRMNSQAALSGLGRRGMIGQAGQQQHRNPQPFTLGPAPRSITQSQHQQQHHHQQQLSQQQLHGGAGYHSSSRSNFGGRPF